MAPSSSPLSSPAVSFTLCVCSRADQTQKQRAAVPTQQRRKRPPHNRGFKQQQLWVSAPPSADGEPSSLPSSVSDAWSARSGARRIPQALLLVELLLRVRVWAQEANEPIDTSPGIPPPCRLLAREATSLPSGDPWDGPMLSAGTLALGLREESPKGLARLASSCAACAMCHRTTTC